MRWIGSLSIELHKITGLQPGQLKSGEPKASITCRNGKIKIPHSISRSKLVLRTQWITETPSNFQEGDFNIKLYDKYSLDSYPKGFAIFKNTCTVKK